MEAVEKGKSARKRRILNAARELVSESDENGLSMRVLAENAGVSVATPYNLFGSKRAVLLQLFEDDARRFGTIFEAKCSSDKLLKIFELNEMTFDFWDNERDYFRNLMSALYRSQDADLRVSVLRPRNSYLKQLVRDCIADGLLDPATNAVLLSRLMVGLHSHIAQDWAAGNVSSERARLDIGYAHSTILLSAGTRRSTHRLLELQHDYQAKLEELTIS